jgi:dipeptidyl aminopeptidase/acylaminoacyl peptidase
LPKDALAKGGDITPFYQPAQFGDLHPTSDGKTLIASMMSVNSPQEVVQIDVNHLDSTACTCQSESPSVVPTFKGIASVTHLNDALLTQLDLPKLESFWFKAKDGTKLQGFLIRPPGLDAQKKYPVKFLIHGGPQGAWGDDWSYRWNAELFAANGYVVIMINMRGSTGYGQAIVDGVNGDWGGKPFTDLMEGLDYAEQHYPFIDKTRECALGASYGGFMADWVLTHTNRFKCIVTHDGMFDPVSAYGSTEEMWFNEWEFRRPEDFPKGWDGFSAGYDPMGKPAKATTEILTGGQNDGQNAGILRSAQNDKQKSEVSQGSGHAAEPWLYQNLPADQDPFRKWSPMRFIENAKTPTLIIHSQKDYRLDVSQGFELYTALQRRGVPARFLYFPDEGHWVLKPQNSQLWYETVDDWCDRWTKTGKYAEPVKGK